MSGANGKSSQPVDRVDGYAVVDNDPGDDRPPPLYGNVDGFVNELTGIGTISHDKTLGGRAGGPDFRVTFPTGVECENRWRGSDLGGRIVETLPNEMIREGWDVLIQPEEGETEEGSEWRRDSRSATLRTLRRMRGDDFPSAQPPAPPREPKPLPESDDDSARVTERLGQQTRELEVRQVLLEALEYERAYGGAAILLGVEDDAADRNPRVKLDDWSAGHLGRDHLDAEDPLNLTAPLDDERIRRVKHLTALRGGFDGEVIAWRYYADPRLPNYGKPEIYMVRNLGVPIAAPPAPGERNPAPQPLLVGPTGPLIFWVHESRLLLFPGLAVSRRARVQMRGWGDSVFTRVNEVLSQYSQSWGSVAVLLQEWAQGVLKMEGLAQMASSTDQAQQNIILQRARLLQMTQSIARVRMLDKEEDFTREIAPLTGVADVLSQFALRLAAAADMPVSMLMGQVKGGLGDAGNTDLRFFYDKVAAKQEDVLVPRLRRLYQLLMLSKDGPTRGQEPRRWQVVMRQLWQPTALEKADLRLKVTQADEIVIRSSQASPEEVAATRYGGSEFNDGPIVLDVEGRKAQAKVNAERPAPPGAAASPEGAPVAGNVAPAARGGTPGGTEEAPPDRAHGQGNGPAPPATTLENTPGVGDAADRRRDGGDFDPSKHPRGEDGKFGEGGGAAGGGAAGEGPKGGEGGAAKVTVREMFARASESEKAGHGYGFTFDPAGQKFPDKGYAVSIHPGHERVIDRKLTGADLRQYVKDKIDFIKANPGAHLGLWFDKDSGKTYLDVSHVVQSKAEATKLARAHNQEGIYSLHEHRTVITKAKSRRRL